MGCLAIIIAIALACNGCTGLAVLLVILALLLS